MNQKNHLIEGPVRKKLIALTIPMIFAMLSMMVFNLVDTFFVSRLGTQDLAAMGFTFPVVLFIINIVAGFGVAASSLVSHAIGTGDEHRVKRLTTDSLVISIAVMLVFAVLGFVTMDWMFGLLGADSQTLPLVKQYMSIWYMGIVFVVAPMVGNSAIRACGDTRTPSMIMIASMVLNLILDPLLIFGLCGFPRMELRGAALATVISRAAALVGAFAVLHFKVKLIDFTPPSLQECIDSAKRFFYIGIPAAISRLLVPVTLGIIMSLVARFGTHAVAAYGVAVKIQMFMFILVMALTTALIPFVGQNWGAKNFGRVKEAIDSANEFSLKWGGISFVLLLALAAPLGHLFGKEAEVAHYIALYLWVVPVSFGLRGCAFLVSTAFNAMHKPMMAIALNLIRMFVITIPLAVLGGRVAGLTGLFIGVSAANVLAGIVSLVMGDLSLKKVTE